MRFLNGFANPLRQNHDGRQPGGTIAHHARPHPRPAPPLPTLLSDEQVRASVQSLCAKERRQPFWLFAYGSLIWRPECPCVETHRAHLSGYHRGLYRWSYLHRGTPEQPGLVLGLDQGGSCQGFVYRLPEDNLEHHLRALWQREMLEPAYHALWLDCRLEDGRRIKALTFVLQRHLPCYAGLLPDSILRQVLLNASGHYGSTLEYVQQTAQCLRRHAMPDPSLEAILERCLG